MMDPEPSFKQTRGILFGPFLVFLLAILLSVGSFLAASSSLAEANEGAPFFALDDLSGEKRTLHDYLGRVVLLHFWATWCSTCRVEMPELEKLYQSLRDRGLMVIAISSDVFGARTVKPFVGDLGLSFPILLDPDSKVTNLYGVSVRPVSYLVNREGNLVTRFIGLKDWTGTDMLEQIEALLDPQASSGS